MASNTTATDSTATPKNSPSEFVGIITWVLLVVSGLAVFSRLATKYAVFKKLASDDGLSLASLLFNIGAGIAVSVLCSNGLGKNINELSRSELESFEKASYALGILYVTCVCFAKLSIIALLRIVTPDGLHRRLSLYTGVLIAVWGGISVLVSAFQCRAPHVWEAENNECVNKSAFWHSSGAINIITDAMLVFLPLYIVGGLKMNKQKKLTVMGCFGARSIDIVATAFQLAYTNGLSSADFTSDIWKWVLIAQIVQTITISTSCIPYLRPLLNAYPSSMFSVDESMMQDSKGPRTTRGYARKTNQVYILRDTKSGASSKSQPASQKKRPADDYADLEIRNIVTHAEIESTPLDERVKWDSSSQTSQSRIIKATTTIDTSWQ